MLFPIVESMVKDLENKLNVWHRKFVDDMRLEMYALRKNIKMKDDKIQNMEIEIGVLKLDQDRLEQYTRRNSLRISGVPEENNEDVCAKVLNL